MTIEVQACCNLKWCAHWRTEEAMLRGQEYRVQLCACSMGRPLASAAEALEHLTGWRIIKADDAEHRMSRLHVNPLLLFRKVEPVLEGYHRHQDYYCRRDVMEVIVANKPRLLCRWCGKRYRHPYSLQEGQKREDIYDCHCCSTACWLAEEQWLKDQRKEVKCLDQQVKALRLFLRNGDPAVFQSLPPGYRPASSSPA